MKIISWIAFGVCVLFVLTLALDRMAGLPPDLTQPIVAPGTDAICTSPVLWIGAILVFCCWASSLKGRF